MIEVTGYIYSAETGETRAHTCKIPKPESKPGLIKVKILDQIGESALLVEPENIEE